jgi:hypothetical protein
MRASRSRTRDATNLLTATPDEAALAIACFLLTARDLLCLRLTCRRFDIKCIAAPNGGGARPAAAPEMLLCLAEEAARRWVTPGRPGAATRSAGGRLGVALRAGWPGARGGGASAAASVDWPGACR